MHTPAKLPGRILVIDDEQSARMLLERVLVRSGHQVSVVETGEQGLEALARGSYDLIVTDKNLPGIDGLEVLRLARSKYPSIQAIVVTGFPTPETEATAREMGVYAFVTKPFGILKIQEACDGAIGAARAGAAASNG